MVLRLVAEVELGVEPDGPLVEQRHVVRPLLRREAFDQALASGDGPLVCPQWPHQ